MAAERIRGIPRLRRAGFWPSINKQKNGIAKDERPIENKTDPLLNKILPAKTS